MILTPQLWFFRGLRLHERVPDAVLDAIREQGRVERWGHSAEIFHDPDSADVYVVLDGGVYVRDGATSDRMRLKRGDAFGGLGAPDEILDEGADIELRRDLLEAYDDTTLVAVERALFDEIASRHLGRNSANIRQLRGKTQLEVPLAPMLYTSPTRRFAKALLHLAETQGQIEGDRAAIDIPYRARPFANLVGLDATRLKAVIEQLRLRGALTFEGKKIAISSLTTLRELAQGQR